MRNKKYQVIIKVGESAIIKSTDKKQEVDEWVKTFMDNKVGSLSIYELNKIGAYDYADGHTFAEPQERLIGFGRWA